MDLIFFINKSGCECLNESNDHSFTDCLQSGGGFLESDCDEQVNYSFSRYKYTMFLRERGGELL